MRGREPISGFPATPVAGANLAFRKEARLLSCRVRVGEEGRDGVAEGDERRGVSSKE